jgi:cell wall-associated NlpC family hydrolase
MILAIGLAVCCAVLSGACASTGGTPRPFPMPGVQPKANAPVPAPSDAAETSSPAAASVLSVSEYELVGTALNLRGVPYKNGGTDQKGFDCSGFTQYVFARFGVALPRDVREQFRTGKAVDLKSLEPGDLLFFTTTEPGASHVGIAVGGDAFIHAPSSTGVVRVERFSSSYWAPRVLGGRRILSRP